jgi:hypothetical protein
MTRACQLDNDGFYDDDALESTLGLRAAALARGRRDGSLRFTRRGGRTLYLGRWVTDWLTADGAEDPARKAVAAC